jgi:hypothetical protein
MTPTRPVPSKRPAGRSLAVVLAALALSPAAGAGADDAPIPDRVQSAVDRGLDWLSKNQERDGSWASAGGGAGRSAAVTGLVAMAFMARGHVPGQGPYGENLNRAVDFVLTLQQRDGVLADVGLGQPMYDHGICTMMLCEVYGMLDEKRQALARTAISRAVRLILNAQNVPKGAEEKGGWRYTADTTSSDLSVSGWQLMALRGAANVGAGVPPGAIKAGIEYVKRRASVGGSFAYTGSGNGSNAMTATGILALCLLGESKAPQVAAGGDHLLRSNITGSPHYFYTMYYCAQAAWQLGLADKKYWDSINGEVSASLIGKQAPDGSWPASGDGDVGRGGQSYGTAMAILALTVPYRYLPIYQR